MYIKDLQSCLKKADLIYSHTQIQAALKKQAEGINQHLNAITNNNEAPVFLPVMNGGLIYAGQLLPLINIPVQVDYIHATRYRNSTRGYDLEWKVYPQHSLENKVVVVLDDIFDEGHTLAAIVEYCKQQGASEVLSSVLVTKQHERSEVDLKVDFSALEVPDRYVFGYGMDYKGYLRNADGIYAI